MGVLATIIAAMNVNKKGSETIKYGEAQTGAKLQWKTKGVSSTVESHGNFSGKAARESRLEWIRTPVRRIDCNNGISCSCDDDVLIYGHVTLAC